ncbi:MAG TPA: mechanosensitive ion channel family protein [Vicinamibacterales bacterium]|nr:mechanosensitive ion channel family protein [Vicinamibacterales bacterium]
MNFDQMPDWVMRLIWTVVTIGGGYVVGHLLNVLILPRLSTLARRTRGDWDDIVLGELKKRLPFWAFLVGIWLALGHWTLRQDVHDLITKILVLIAGASITLAIAGTLTRLLVLYQQRTAPDVPVTGLAQSLVRIAVLIVGILMIARALGLDITAALTALGVGGLAVALALQEPLSNLFAGLFLSLARQIRVGDFVRLETGQEGFVADLDWRSTRIRMLSNNIVIVPNAKLAQSIVVNYQMPEADVSVLVQVGVDYDSDLAQVERVTIEVARDVMATVEGGVPTHEPFIRYHTFADSSINFSVILRGKQFTDQYLVSHEFIKRLHQRYASEGIRIPFPIRTLTGRGPVPVVVVPPPTPASTSAPRT